MAKLTRPERAKVSKLEQIIREHSKGEVTDRNLMRAMAHALLILLEKLDE